LLRLIFLLRFTCFEIGSIVSDWIVFCSGGCLLKLPSIWYLFWSYRLNPGRISRPDPIEAEKRSLGSFRCLARSDRCASEKKKIATAVPPDPRVTGEEARRRAGIAHARAPSAPPRSSRGLAQLGARARVHAWDRGAEIDAPAPPRSARTRAEGIWSLAPGSPAQGSLASTPAAPAWDRPASFAFSAAGPSGPAHCSFACGLRPLDSAQARRASAPWRFARPPLFVTIAPARHRTEEVCPLARAPSSSSY
jgi:hypothetical protein